MNQIHLACDAIEFGLYSCPLIREAWKTAGEGGSGVGNAYDRLTGFFPIQRGLTMLLVTFCDRNQLLLDGHLGGLWENMLFIFRLPPLFVIKFNLGICTFTILPSSFKVEVFVTMATRATLKLTRKA